MTSKRTTAPKLRYAQSPKKWSPHTYQKKAVKFLLEHACAALLLDPGLGKTSVTLAAFSFLLKRKIAFKMLVIAPIRVAHQVWPSEILEWADFHHLRCVVLHGPNKDKLLEQDADVYVINPEGLEWLVYGSAAAAKAGAFSAARWRKLGFDTLCIDELTKFKHSKGTRFKALKNTLQYFSRRWGLTGTPVANGLLDLFGQCYVLDLGNALGKYITHYRMTYFTNPDGNGWKWVLQPGAKEKIYEKIKPLALRMSAEDYLELPPLLDTFTMLDLPPKVQQMYDKLEHDLIMRVESGEVVAAHAGAASMKLRQIANGGVYVDDDVKSKMMGKAVRGTVELHDIKNQWIGELVDELNGAPLLISYEFEQDLHRLQSIFGEGLPYIGGGVSAKLGKHHEEAWNRDEYHVMAVHPASVAHGVNLQKGSGSHLAHYAMTWNFEEYDQLIRRIRRQGSKAQRIHRYHAIMRNTVDEDMKYSIQHKDKGQQAFFAALTARAGRK